MSTVLAGAEWVVRAEDEEACGVICLLCSAESGPDAGSPRLAGVWAIEHARRNVAGHDQFLATARVYWRAVPRTRPAARPPGPEPMAKGRPVWADVVAGSALLGLVVLAAVTLSWG
ncbi:DUF7848 domain-containing protein [Streptomyces sp. NBC_01803]|uniref:DUF7848 domain-containing protein n=1 Tax=Streptomyces sp. NBC_01803 TaxID=2975946 RepID=UPI002DD9721C|nr:hypothetical protein [Streptomyces sp. NBC_01803]WSA44119.1 hypothetical protein OIE51_07810 [Streptomyces sp. NBC_01803]